MIINTRGRVQNTAGDFAYVHSSPRAHRYSNGTLVISDAEERDAGAYMCQANNGIGAVLSKIVSLQVLASPRFKESFQSQSTREGSNATLKCDATGHAPITITWQKNKNILDSKSNERNSAQYFPAISSPEEMLYSSHIYPGQSGLDAEKFHSIYHIGHRTIFPTVTQLCNYKSFQVLKKYYTSLHICHTVWQSRCEQLQIGLFVEHRIGLSYL
ncbi:hypothetical protein CEXT_304642 [Caerostris extrusa]|uniref:Ig-like domain-containing protein n=1 Tax=Caerostris extrusa TaxID=172846 RepID=A0AAV4XP25_CAEEX|nr:hypothetical protein CEXT_304642 [Caerostris extrusa]